MKYWCRWIGDWRVKTAQLTLLERGAYSEMLDHCYATEAPLPAEPDAIYRMLSAFTPEERGAVDNILKRFFSATPSGYENSRVVEEIHRRNAYVERQRALANRRWNPPPKENKKLASVADTSATWNSYAAAYQSRYGCAPVRNARTNALIKQLVARIGLEESPQVCAFFLTHNNAFYVKKGHALTLLLADAEKLRTEWATGRKITDTAAQQADKRETNLQAFQPLIEEARRRETAK